jgi:adenylate kinase
VCQSTFHETFRPPAEPGVCDVCGGRLFRRADDNPAILHNRLDAFRRNIAPVLRHYRSRDRLAQVDANGTIEEVTAKLAALLDSLARGEVSADQLPGGADITVPGRIARPPARPSVDVVLLGGPGSGKGTQASRFAELLGVPHISTGELFRENLAEQTELGRLAKSYMDHGELVPDDITEAMVRERLSRPDTERGFILDGYPRTRAQAESLDAMLSEIGRRLTAALNIRVSDDEIFRRLAGRGREDDDPQTVKTRLKTFHTHNGSLLDYYREAGVLQEIDGEGPPDEVTARALAVLEPLVTR